MENMNSSHVKSESDCFDLDESCIRSDIENIIKKMYNPEAKVSCDRSRDDTRTDFLQSNRYVVNKDSTHTFYSSPTTCSDSNETVNKRFGFYFESFRKNDIRTTVVESSTSDSVSIPKNKRRLRRSRVVCDCCRRRISQFNHGRTNYCKVCNDPKVFHPEVTSNRLKLEGKNSSEGKGQGDTLYLDADGKSSGLTFCVEKKSKHSSKPIPNKKLSRLTVKPVASSRSNNEGSNLRDIRTDHLQIVPDLEKGIVEETESQKRFNSEKPGDLKTSSKPRSATVFGRVFSTFSIYFSKSKLPNEADSKSKVEKLNKISENNETKKHSSLVVLKMKPHGPSQDSSGGLHHKTELFSHQVENNSRCRICDEGRACKSIIHNDPLTSSVINLEPKPSYYNIKSQDKTDRKGGGFKTSSVRICKSNCHQEFIGDVHNSFHSRTRLRDKSELSRETLTSRNTYEPKLTMSDVLEESMDSIHVGNFEETKLSQAEGKSIVEVIQKNNNRATKFWVKTFGSCQIVIAFFTTFVLELLKFVFKSLLYPLLCGPVQVCSEHFFKPSLTAIFEGLIEPIFGFLESVAKSSSAVCLPVSECFGHFIKQIASLCGNCRLVEVHKTYNKCEENSRNP